LHENYKAEEDVELLFIKKRVFSIASQIPDFLELPLSGVRVELLTT